MHPFYGPSARLAAGRPPTASGLVSMAAYLAFWAGAIFLAKRELDARFPRVAPGGPGVDPALGILRERFARGEIDAAQFRAMAELLGQAPAGQE